MSATRWPGSLDAGQWDDGTSLAFMQRLVDHWLHRFDWRAQEARLNRLPQYLPPRSWVERAFNVQRWTAMPRGGHFAALDQPELLVEEIRAFFRPLRGA